MAQIPLTWDGKDAQGQPLRWDTGLKWNGFLPQPTPTKMPQLRVLLGFASAADHSLEETATAVHSKLYTVPAFANPPTVVPPVAAADLLSALTDFTDAIAAAKQGGPQDTADKNNKRQELISLLRKLAGHVQGLHENDLAVLLSSGFEAVSTNNASGPLAAPDITDIVADHTGQLKLRVTAVANTRSYEVRYALLSPDGTPGPWQNGGLYTNSRAMVVTPLTPGANYTFQVRGIGGSSKYSDWSNSVTHRCM